MAESILLSSSAFYYNSVLQKTINFILLLGVTFPLVSEETSSEI